MIYGQGPFSGDTTAESDGQPLQHMRATLVVLLPADRNAALPPETYCTVRITPEGQNFHTLVHAGSLVSISNAID